MLRLLVSPALLQVSPSAQPVVSIELRCSRHIDQPGSQREPGIVSQLLTITTATTVETHHTAPRPSSLRFTPQLIPKPFDIIHPIQNHKAILPQRASRSRIGSSAGHLLCARIIVHAPRMGSIVRRDDVDFVALFGGGDCAGGEEVVLGLFEEGGELVGAVGEARAGVAGEDYELC